MSEYMCMIFISQVEFCVLFLLFLYMSFVGTFFSSALLLYLIVLYFFLQYMLLLFLQISFKSTDNGCKQRSEVRSCHTSSHELKRCQISCLIQKGETFQTVIKGAQNLSWLLIKLNYFFSKGKSLLKVIADVPSSKGQRLYSLLS
jgi:hypothetical protein